MHDLEHNSYYSIINKKDIAKSSPVYLFFITLYRVPQINVFEIISQRILKLFKI